MKLQCRRNYAFLILGCILLCFGLFQLWREPVPPLAGSVRLHDEAPISEAFRRKIWQDMAFCQNNNYVASNDLLDSYFRIAEIAQQVPSNATCRPFSLREVDWTMARHQECSSVEDLLQAIQLGHRIWDEVHNDTESVDTSINSQWTWREREANPSSFLPYQCDIPILYPPQMCNILRQFAHVVLLGDSLSRHTWQGLVTGIQPDLVRGWSGMVDHPSTMNASFESQYCFCDGQYSAHVACRKVSMETMMHNFTLETYCSGDLSFPTMYMHPFAHGQGNDGFDNLQHMDCTDPSRAGPVLMILQGGLHFDSNALRTYQHFSPILHHPQVLECARQRRLLVIWCSYNTHSPSIYSKYPHQSASNGLRFNKEMKKWLEGGPLNVTIVDWMNFTAGAQTSDGVHYLTNINYFKAQHLLLLADHMLREQRYSTTH